MHDNVVNHYLVGLSLPGPNLSKWFNHPTRVCAVACETHDRKWCMRYVFLLQANLEKVITELDIYRASSTYKYPTNLIVGYY